MAYPMSEGYAKMVQTGAYTYLGHTERYRHRRRGTAVEVTAELPDGLQLSRRYRLRDGVLTVASQLRNRGTAPVQAAWGAALHLLAAGATTCVPTPDGTTPYPWSTLPDGLAAARILSGPHCPRDTCWTDVDDYRITLTFPPAHHPRHPRQNRTHHYPGPQPAYREPITATGGANTGAAGDADREEGGSREVSSDSRRWVTVHRVQRLACARVSVAFVLTVPIRSRPVRTVTVINLRVFTW